MGAGTQPAHLTRAATLVFAAAAAVGGAADTASSQGLILEARIAADADGSGPAAWSWIRRSILRRLPASADVDPLGDLRIVLGEGGDIRVEQAVGIGDGAYAQFVLSTQARRIATGVCDFDGEERWSSSPGAEHESTPPTLQTLVSRFGFEARTGWLELDLAAAAGNLMVGTTDGDLVGELLTLGAMGCGAVSVTAEQVASSWRITGRSEGGLALPAVLLVLADAQARRSPNAASLDTNLERWLLLAASALAEEQEEAARQLSRFRDPRVAPALERLLLADGRVRLVAMHGLARIGSVASMAGIAAAAEPGVPGSAAVAARSILALMPPAVRDAMAVGSLRASAQLSTQPPAPELETLMPRTPTIYWAPWATALMLGATLGYLLALRSRR